MTTRITVMGAGAIGSIAAVHLADGGASLTLVDPYVQAHLDAVKTNGLKIRPDGGTPAFDEHVCKIAVADHVGSIQGGQDVVIIATKAFALQEVVRDLKQRFEKNERKGMTFVCLQNGYGNEKYVSDELDTNALRVAVNYVGSVTAPGTVSGHWLSTKNFIGPAYPDKENASERMAELMNASKLYAENIPDIRVPTFYKVILNSTLCPICAAVKKTMIQAMKDEKLRAIVRHILLEGLEVAKAMGIEYPEKQTDIDVMYSYLEAGGDHPTSMRQDLWRGNMTEIQWLNGAIVKVGREHGVDTPYNEHFVRIITAMEQSAAAAVTEIYKKG